MKTHDGNRHPGPWRVMSGDVEFAGFIVAIGFLVMGLVVPIAKWFVIGAVGFGFVVALLLRRFRSGNVVYAGFMVAIGSLVTALVFPIARWFVLGAVGFGVVVALLLRLRKE